MKHQVKGQNAAKLDMHKLARYVEQHIPMLTCMKLPVSLTVRQLRCCTHSEDWASPEKKTATYKEQDPNKVRHYLQQLAKLSSHLDYQTVYLDEAGFDTCLSHPYGCRPKGQVLKAKIRGKGYRRISLVAAQIGNKLIAFRLFTIIP